MDSTHPQTPSSAIRARNALIDEFDMEEETLSRSQGPCESLHRPGLVWALECGLGGKVA